MSRWRLRAANDLELRHVLQPRVWVQLLNHAKQLPAGPCFDLRTPLVRKNLEEPIKPLGPERRSHLRITRRLQDLQHGIAGQILDGARRPVRFIFWLSQLGLPDFPHPQGQQRRADIGSLLVGERVAPSLDFLDIDGKLDQERTHYGVLFTAVSIKPAYTKSMIEDGAVSLAARIADADGGHGPVANLAQHQTYVFTVIVVVARTL